MESIGVKDNFFDLGGTSLLALQMLREIEQRFAQKLPLATFLKAATVEELAKVLQKEDQSELWSTLIPIQPNGQKPPLYCVHGSDGNVLVFQNLVEYLDSEQPLYGLQPPGLDQKDCLNRVEDIANEYIRHIRNFQPEGPYYLAGFSLGGTIVFEMAQQLLAQGQEVALLALFDSICIEKYLKQLLSQKNWLVYHFRTFISLKPQHKLVYLRGGLQDRWHKITQALQPKVVAEIPEIDETDDQKLFVTLSNAVRNYTPQVYPGKITLFRCVEQKWSVNHDRELGWAEFTEKIEVIDIPGSHNESVRANAKFLAQELRRYLT